MSVFQGLSTGKIWQPLSVGAVEFVVVFVDGLEPEAVSVIDPPEPVEVAEEIEVDFWPADFTGAEICVGAGMIATGAEPAGGPV